MRNKKKNSPGVNWRAPNLISLQQKEAPMIDNISDIYKPAILDPESLEYQSLVADLARRDQHLEPHSQIARHPEYAHVYATDAGEVINAWKRCEARPARIASLSKRQDGYLSCKVTIARGRQRTLRAHRTVLECFAGPCPKGRETCHRNSCRSDNRLENLYWGTPDNQVNDKKIAGSIPVGERNGRAILTRELVIEARRRVKSGEQLRAVARKFNVDGATLDAAVYGAKWKCVDSREPPAVRKIQSSKLRGVAWHKASGKWIANATVAGKMKHLGSFTSENDAAFFFERQCRLDSSCTSRPNKSFRLDCTHQPEGSSDVIQNAVPIGTARPAGFQVFAKKESNQDSKQDGGAA